MQFQQKCWTYYFSMIIKILGKVFLMWSRPHQLHRNGMIQLKVLTIEIADHVRYRTMLRRNVNNSKK